MMILTEKEKMALRVKMENPDKRVVYPRCGAEIIYEEHGNSIVVECSTKGCIYGGLRGYRRIIYAMV